MTMQNQFQYSVGGGGMATLAPKGATGLDFSQILLYTGSLIPKSFHIAAKNALPLLLNRK